KIPQNITDTFAPSINLCSDDDEEEDSRIKKADRLHGKSAIRKEKRKHSKTKEYITPKLDEDDDLEFVSIDYLKNSEENDQNVLKKESSTCKKEYDIDVISKDILNKIDELAAEDLKQKCFVHEPVDYTFKMESENSNLAENTQEHIFQRRVPSTDILFKRRADFNADEVVVECLNDDKSPLCSSNKLETITLDSDSESEFNNDNEQPSTSNGQIHNEEILPKETRIISGNSVKVSDILNEVEEISNHSKSHESEKPVELEESDKENMEKNDGIPGTPNLDPAQISKILEDISSKTDFEIDTFYEALQCVRQMNLEEQKEIPETLPPAPPPIPPSAIPVQPGHEQQQPPTQLPMTLMLLQMSTLHPQCILSLGQN
ncbi:hypothetical protein EVAR_70642_1, partial [Eumeta japonica]